MACGPVSLHFLSPRMPMAFAPSSLSSSSPSSSFSSSSSSSAASAAALEIRLARSAPPMPPLNPREPFLSKLATAAPDPLALALSGNRDTPPYIDLFASPTLMASPAQGVLSRDRD